MERFYTIASLFVVLFIVQFFANPNYQVRAMWCGLGFENSCDPYIREIKALRSAQP